MQDFQAPDSVSLAKKPLGEILVEAGLVSIRQIELALKEQNENNLPIGDIIVSHGWIQKKTVDFFAERWLEALKEKPKKPSVFYFEEAGLLDKEQINTVIKLQKLKQNKVRFHPVAVEQGYLKQMTIDFFLAHLFNILNSKAILTEVNFTRSFCRGANLREAHLEKANFQSAILSEVDFQAAYLAEANFSGADLTKAKLPLDYPYKVYYDNDTIFDNDFDPKLMGWQNTVNRNNTLRLG